MKVVHLKFYLTNIDNKIFDNALLYIKCIDVSAGYECYDALNSKIYKYLIYSLFSLRL